jgi:hypothetical protein
VTHLHLCWPADKLSSLTVLDLSDNQLSGSLTSALTGLPTLRVVALSNNQLSGLLPDGSNAWGNGVQVVLLDGNRFSGKLPTGTWPPGLQTLVLSNNRLGAFMAGPWVQPTACVLSSTACSSLSVVALCVDGCRRQACLCLAPRAAAPSLTLLAAS